MNEHEIKITIEEQSYPVIEVHEDGSSEDTQMTRVEILDKCRSTAKTRIISLPFGEVLARDLRMLQPIFEVGEPKIQIRTLCALISIDPVHAFLLPDCVLLLVPGGADGFIELIRKYMKETVEENNLGKISQIMDLDKENNQLKIDSEAIEASNNLLLIDKNEFIRESEQTEVLNVEKTISQTADEVISVEESNQDFVPSPEKSNSPKTIEKNNKEYQKEGQSISEPPRPKRKLSISSSTSSREKHILTREPSYSTNDKKPFHLIGLDALFRTLEHTYKSDVTFIDLIVKDALSIQTPSQQCFDKLHGAQRLVDSLTSKLLAARKALNDFYDDEKELSLMSFNSIIECFAKDDDVDSWTPHESEKTEAERLTENLLFCFDDLISQMNEKKSSIESTNSTLLLNLGATANSLLKLNVILQALTAGAAIAALVAGLFGMNLNSGLSEEPTTTTFWTVVGVLLGFTFVFTLLLVGGIWSKGMFEGLTNV